MESTGAAINQADLLADVREAFIQLEAAVSMAQPDKARQYVGPELYEQLVGTVRDLTSHGQRRVHGAFEILTSDLLEPPSTEGPSPPRASVRLHATSSLLVMDRQNRIIQGTDERMLWTQEVTATSEPPNLRWVISDLKEMTIEGPVKGPSGPPLKMRELTDLEERERQSEEHARAFVNAGLNFLSLHASR